MERIVGKVDDEFDTSGPNIVPEDSGSYLVVGSTPLEELRSRLNLASDESNETNTIAGLLMHVRQKVLTQGETIELNGAVCEVLDMKNDSAVIGHILLSRVTIVTRVGTLDDLCR